ncbi:MAG: hypothetical protein JSS81_01565 [Acidobacteria bacterium]|nr:hypothetical protein [Acidobacteriota bacterium]
MSDPLYVPVPRQNIGFRECPKCGPGPTYTRVVSYSFSRIVGLGFPKFVLTQLLIAILLSILIALSVYVSGRCLVMILPLLICDFFLVRLDCIDGYDVFCKRCDTHIRKLMRH